MSDPIAAADQAAKEIEGVARIHAAYYLQLLTEGMTHEHALSAMQTMMWVLSSKDDDCDCED